MIVSFEFMSAYLQAKAVTERGASLVEYALLVALIAIVCIAAVSALGKKANSSFSSVSGRL